jgi:hypothetical protein
MKFLPDSGGYKSTSWGRELRRIQTHMPQTMGSKQPETWSPRWVRQKHREKNNGLPSNDPNYDEKSPADAERPLYKCDLDCQSHKSLDHDTYGRRYWSCPQSTCMFHWGWDEEKPRKIVSIVTLILHILNLVIINLFFKWCLCYALPTAIETIEMWFQTIDWWLYDTEGHRVHGMGEEEQSYHEQGGSSSKLSGVLYFVLVFHFPKACQV